MNPDIYKTVRAAVALITGVDMKDIDEQYYTGCLHISSIKSILKIVSRSLHVPTPSTNYGCSTVGSIVRLFEEKYKHHSALIREVNDEMIEDYKNPSKSPNLMNNDIVKKCVINWVAHFMNTEPENISESTELSLSEDSRFALFGNLDKVFDFVSDAVDDNLAHTVGDVIKIYDGLIPYEDGSIDALDDDFKRNYIIGAIATEAVVDKYSIKPETTFRTLHLTSKDVADIIYDLEEEFGLQHPFHKLSEIKTVADFLKVFGIAPACDTGSPEELEAVKQAMGGDLFAERVNHPQHYALPNGLEAIDIARHLSFDLGNVVKYVVRAGRKSEQGLSNDEKRLEDLKKALFYLQDEINHLS